RLGRRVQLPAVDDPCVVREYAHQHKRPEGRRDLVDTVYWHPVLVMPDGKADVKFDLPDTVTTFQVLVHSNTFDGRLGTNRLESAAKQRVSLAAPTAAEVCNKDEIGIPLQLYNGLSQPWSSALSIRSRGLKVEDNAERAIELKAKEERRELVRVKPTINEGAAGFRIVNKSAGSIAALERQIKVVPDGFPVTGSFS